VIWPFGQVPELIAVVGCVSGSSRYTVLGVLRTKVDHLVLWETSWALAVGIIDER